MIISISTANLYDVPFEKVLNIYKAAGYEHIELAGYWKGGEWEIGQHLKGIAPKDAISAVQKNGLKISSFHDMGGVIEDGAESIISATTYEYLEYYDFPCLVFHAPHKKGATAAWWAQYKEKAMEDLQAVKENRLICVENLFEVENYFMPLITPLDMLDFANYADVYVNADTTHYAHSKFDIVGAVKTLGNRLKTIHLSDYKKREQHVHLGKGVLDFASFFKTLDLTNIYSVCVECKIKYDPSDDRVAIESAKKAREFVERFVWQEREK